MTLNAPSIEPRRGRGPNRAATPISVLVLVLLLAMAPVHAGFEDATTADAESWWSRLTGADEDELRGYADQVDGALDGGGAAELERRGYGDVRSDWDGAKDAFFSGDTEALRGYADRVDSALGGDIGAELDQRGYGAEARSWWERVKGWLFDDGAY